MKRNYKSIGILILTFLVQSFVFGQELLPQLIDSTLSRRQITVWGNAFEHSSSLYNNFSRKLIFGGQIQREVSQQAYDRLDPQNRIGGGYRIGIEYRGTHQLFKTKPNWSWMVSVANCIQISGNYTKDLFGLIFIGNESYLGKSAVLTNTTIRYEKFLSIGGGIHDRKSKSFMSLHLILPQQFSYVDLGQTSLTFNAIGSQIDLIAQGDIIQSNSHAYFKGMGAAVNFDFNIPFGKGSGFNGIVGISVRNIGAYELYKSKRYSIDTKKSYAGFSLNDLTQQKDFPSLMDTLGVQQSTKSVWKLLPGFIQVGKIVNKKENVKVQSFFGARMYLNMIYRPMIYAGIHYQPISQFSVGAQASYGGYGNFRLGLYLNYSGKNIIFGIGTEDLLGAILGKQFGHSGLIRLQWQF